MSDRIEHFKVDEPTRVDVTLRAGDVRLERGEPGMVEVRVDGAGADRFRIDKVGTSIVVEAERGRSRSFRSADVSILLPPGSDVDIQLTAGDVTSVVDLGVASVVTTAGDVRIGAAASVRIKTVSGDINLDSSAGDVHLVAASGDVTAGRVLGTIYAKTVSGDIKVVDFRGARADVQSMAGDVTLGMPPGRSLRVDIQTLSGDLRNDFALHPSDAGGEIELNVRTISGDVVLRPA